MVIDTSAFLAILQDEPDRRSFTEAIGAAVVRRTSAATLLEASMVPQSRYGAEGIQRLDMLLESAGIDGARRHRIGRIPDFPVTRSHPPASWPSAANSSICRTYRKTAGEESRRRSPVANRWMRP